MIALSLTSHDIHSLWEGTQVTVQVTVLSILLGLALSLIGGVANSSRIRLARWLSRIFIEFFRGIAAVILLFWAAYALPILFGVNMSALQAGVLALGANMGAYGSEIVRSAIQSVPQGQTEASIALNLSPAQRLRSVVLPQAVRIMLPPFGNLLIELLKGTALVSLIQLSDVFDHAAKIRNNHIDKSVALYTSILIVYFVLSLVITLVMRTAERIVGRPYRTEPPRGLASLARIFKPPRPSADLEVG